jgi:hypothetical protein
MTLNSLVRTVPAWVALPVLAAFALAGCSNKPVPPCPQVRVDSNTARYVKFVDTSKDLTRIDHAIEMVGYDGQCKFGKKGVDLTMDLVFDVVAGPASKGGKVPVSYFIAIPQFYPKPEGKRVMTLQAELPKTAGARTRVKDSGVHVFIPLDRDEPGAAYDVYVGLQISDADAAYNESRRAQQTTPSQLKR